MALDQTSLDQETLGQPSGTEERRQGVVDKGREREREKGEAKEGKEKREEGEGGRGRKERDGYKRLSK